MGLFRLTCLERKADGTWLVDEKEMLASLWRKLSTWSGILSPWGVWLSLFWHQDLFTLLDTFGEWLWLRAPNWNAFINPSASVIGCPDPPVTGPWDHACSFRAWGKLFRQSCQRTWPPVLSEWQVRRRLKMMAPSVLQHLMDSQKLQRSPFSLRDHRRDKQADLISPRRMLHPTSAGRYLLPSWP